MTEEKRIIEHYGRVDHTQIEIYTRGDMHDATFDLGRFGELPIDRISVFADLMCGKKYLVGQEMKKRADANGITLQVHCLDLVFKSFTPEELAKMSSTGYLPIAANITDGIPYVDGFLHRSAARYGIKNYPAEEQLKILREIRRATAEGGYFVLIDMLVSRGASKETDDWLQAERRHKSKYTVGEENSRHHIPTFDEWQEYLRESGFKPGTKIFEAKSYITPTDAWVKSNQMSEEDAIRHEQFLLEAPEEARRLFNIREEMTDGISVVKIDYPVFVIGAKAV